MLSIIFETCLEIHLQLYLKDMLKDVLTKTKMHQKCRLEITVKCFSSPLRDVQIFTYSCISKMHQKGGNCTKRQENVQKSKNIG